MGKVKSCAAGDLDRQQTECPSHKYFGCRSVDNLIAKCLKPPEYNKMIKDHPFQWKG